MTVTDGKDWVRITPEEAEHLLDKRLMHGCTGSCGPGSFHPMNSITEVEKELEVLRGYRKGD